MSFVDKIRGIAEKNASDLASAGVKVENLPSSLSKLDVDIIQTQTKILIYATVPGVSLDDIEISIGDENDVVTIEGMKAMPADSESGEKKNLRSECQWGMFFREIILPQEINVAEVEAKLDKGVLTLKMPLIRLAGKGKKRIEVKTS
jgi:HSP20 family protein